MNEQQRLNILAHVFDLLQDCAERHEICADTMLCDYCMDDGCKLDTPHCDTMKARRARWEIARLIEPPLESLQQERLTNPAERIYHEVWLKINERSPGLNHGFTALEWILCPSGQKWPEPVSHRDAQVATSVIQYLGTNGGRGLMHQAELRIEQERAVRSDIDRDAMRLSFGPPPDDAPPQLDQFATIVASRALPVTHIGYTTLETFIKAALRRAYDAGARHADEFVRGIA